jgi:hypothetical protein
MIVDVNLAGLCTSEVKVSNHKEYPDVVLCKRERLVLCKRERLTPYFNEPLSFAIFLIVPCSLKFRREIFRILEFLPSSDEGPKRLRTYMNCALIEDSAF